MTKGGLTSQERGRYAVACFVALTLHIGVAVTITQHRPLPAKSAPLPIPVKLIIEDRAPAPIIAQPAEATPPTKATPAPVSAERDDPLNSVPESPSAPVDESVIELDVNPPSPNPIQPPVNVSNIPLQASPADTGAVLIPERWRLPSGARISLDKMTQEKSQFQQNLDCLKGFSVDCADLRENVFAEEQLSETDLVWMPSYAHSGLSNSDFYGMSEEQIRERLGIPSAGKNGFMILPGIGIDGPIWDALHGVNKACDYSVVKSDAGETLMKKNCKTLKPAATEFRRQYDK